MKYKGYSARDFANDSFFIRRVKHPDEESEWFWKSFLKENPLSEPEIEKARELIEIFDFPEHHLPEEEVSGMRNGLLMALRADREELKDHIAFRRGSHSKTGRQWLKLAAAIIIVPLIPLAAYFFAGGMNDKLTFHDADHKDGVEKKVNSAGQKSVLFLNDGTKVWLNVATKISYPRDFTDHRTRDVYLDGEAFFDVAHNVDKPFIVHTTSLRIKVLGTSFNVKSYSEETTVETTLVQGKVRIEQSDVEGNRIGDVELKPNQRAVFNKESKVIKIKEVQAASSGTWKQERLVFDGEPIDQVLLQMERWYQVKIHLENRENLKCKMTATIENESLEEVLKLLETSNNVHYKIEGKDVFLQGTFCESD